MVVLCSAADRFTSNRTFEEVFRRYQRRVTAWCFRFTADRSKSNDLAQEVFFKAYRKRDSYRGDSRLSTWLYAITRNHCVNSLKQNSMQTLEISDLTNRGLRAGGGMDVYAAINDGEALRKVWRIIGPALTPTEARVITLHYAYEWPLAVITRRLSLDNPSGAKAYIVNARRKIAKALHRQRPPERTNGA